ncbi:flagellar basal body-associated FliL family protein [Uliginosibacterium sp. H3]|uniref:Flagellar protein FliL n=1 Tax=Uliginosibacterium silvisoli TaxID=3114758 RepID=A0ABU6K5R8_9RHOO|nr:flagellar basal body-associated FliL family protein [Uliginosibacterium sp. H3]
MASKEVKKEEGADAAPPKKSKKLLIIIVGVVVVTLALGAGVGYLMGHKKPAGDGAHGEEASAESKHEEKSGEPKKPPVFVALEPFTVNLQADASSGEQFLQAVVSLRVADEKKGEELKAYMPQIRHEILGLAGAKKAAEITTPEGREALAEDIKDTVNEVLGYEPPKRSKRKKKDEGPDEDAPVMAVFFTQFIVQ